MRSMLLLQATERGCSAEWAEGGRNREKGRAEQRERKGRAGKRRAEGKEKQSGEKIRVPTHPIGLLKALSQTPCLGYQGFASN